jgi:hypothetical protein
MQQHSKTMPEPRPALPFLIPCIRPLSSRPTLSLLVTNSLTRHAALPRDTEPVRPLVLVNVGAVDDNPVPAVECLLRGVLALAPITQFICHAAKSAQSRSAQSHIGIEVLGHCCTRGGVCCDAAMRRRHRRQDTLDWMPNLRRVAYLG